MAKKKKGPRGIVAMRSAASGHSYYTTRNKRNRQEKGQGKLELRKYDPITKQHETYKEDAKLK